MATSERTILVAGATGHQGGAVAHHLLKRGKFNVRALVRDKHINELKGGTDAIG